MIQRIRTAGFLLLLLTGLRGQGDLPFPTEEYFGGGIGYTPMFLQLNLAQVFPFSATGDDAGLLGESLLGFTAENLKPLDGFMVVHGAEGFGNITGNWRIGAYVGLGSKGISKKDSATGIRQDLKVTLMTGNVSLEMVVPVFSNLEVSAGSLFGFSRGIIQFASTAANPDWNEQFEGTDTTNVTVSLSGTFFSFHPYIALKYQFLNRAGLRMSAGYQVGTLAANRWKLNDFQDIIAPSKSSFNAPAVRVMLYVGI